MMNEEEEPTTYVIVYAPTELEIGERVQIKRPRERGAMVYRRNSEPVYVVVENDDGTFGLELEEELEREKNR
jgi:hypothetical protein